MLETQSVNFVSALLKQDTLTAEFSGKRNWIVKYTVTSLKKIVLANLVCVYVVHYGIDNFLTGGVIVILF